MRPGRPAMREQFRREILDVLGPGLYPATVTKVKQLIDSRHLRPCGWDTVRKYLEELAAERLVLRQSLPTRDQHKPLVIYWGRGRSDR